MMLMLHLQGLTHGASSRGHHSGLASYPSKPISPITGAFLRPEFAF